MIVSPNLRQLGVTNLPLIKQHDALDETVSWPDVAEECVFDEEPALLPLCAHQARAEVVTSGDKNVST